jgi:F0F1-type ATP synthase assembly protein I
MFIPRDQREQLKQVLSLSTIGLELGLSIAVGYFGGRWLDAKLGTEPWLQWFGLALGLAAGARSLYRVVRRAQRILDEEDETQ